MNAQVRTDACGTDRSLVRPMSSYPFAITACRLNGGSTAVVLLKQRQPSSTMKAASAIATLRCRKVNKYHNVKAPDARPDKRAQAERWLRSPTKRPTMVRGVVRWKNVAIPRPINRAIATYKSQSSQKQQKSNRNNDSKLVHV